MPVNAGEVEVVLTARDGMSARFEAAAAKAAMLERQISDLGIKAGPTFLELNAKLEATNDRLFRLSEQSQVAAKGLKNVGDDAQASGQKLSQVENLAQRMIERLLILYAIRGTMSFVADLFESAAELEDLNQKFDVSVGKLQELKYEGEQTGVKFTTTAAAIDGMQRRLAELKPTTVDALKDIGISFEKIFSLNPEDRLELVLTTLEKMPSTLQRTAAEVKIFGTDALDPMIKRHTELAKAAHDAGAVLGDDQVKQLADADKAFKTTGDTIKIFAANLLVASQNAVTLMATPLFSGDKTAAEFFGALLSGGVQGAVAFATAEQFANSGRKQMGDITIPPAGSTGPGGKDVPTYGDARIKQLEAEKNSLDSLTDAQLRNLDSLEKMNMLTADEAAKQGLSTTQYREFMKALRESESDWKLVNREFERFDEMNTKFTKAQQDTIIVMRLQGASLRDIAEQLGDPKLEGAIGKFERQYTTSLERMDKAGKEFLRELEANVASIAKALNDEADATGGPGNLQPTSTGNKAFDDAANKRNAAVDAAQRRLQQQFVGPLADQEKAANERAALAEMAKAERTFIDETTAAARAAKGMADAADQAAAADRRKAQDAFNASMQVKDSGSPFPQGWRPGDWQKGGQIQLPSHADGGPTQEGPAYLHDAEYVVPSKGALVMRGGGGDTYHITIPLQGLAITTDPNGLAQIERVVTKAVGAVMRQGRRFPSA